MYVHVCMYMYVCTCMYVCMYVHMYVLVTHTCRKVNLWHHQYWMSYMYVTWGQVQVHVAPKLAFWGRWRSGWFVAWTIWSTRCGTVKSWWSWWLVTKKAKALFFFSFHFVVCINSNTQAEDSWRVGGSYGTEATGCICTSTGVLLVYSCIGARDAGISSHIQCLGDLVGGMSV